MPNVVERLDREGLKVIQTTAGKWKRTATASACALQSGARERAALQGKPKEPFQSQMPI